jgi:hypothetical protein
MCPQVFKMLRIPVVSSIHQYTSVYYAVRKCVYYIQPTSLITQGNVGLWRVHLYILLTA